MADTRDDFTLLPARKREVATALEAAGMNTRQFKWETVKSMSDATWSVSRLVHVPTGFYYQFDCARETRPVRLHPGRDRWREDINLQSVDDQITTFSDIWLGLLADQIEAGDPTTEFADAEDVFAEARREDNDAFTAADREEFTRRLEAIRTLLLAQAADDQEAMRQTNERIDYLIDRIGRRDWLFMAFCSNADSTSRCRTNRSGGCSRCSPEAFSN